MCVCVRRGGVVDEQNLEGKKMLAYYGLLQFKKKNNLIQMFDFFVLFFGILSCGLGVFFFGQ